MHGVKTGTLPRNHLAVSATGGASAYFLSLLTKSMPPETKRKNCWEKYATGGASAIRNTVVSAGFQPLWGVKTGTLPRNRLAFSATGGASAIILAFSRRCAILNPSHIQRQSRDLRVAPMGAQCRRNGELSAGRNGIALQCRSRIPLPHSGYLRGSKPRRYMGTPAP